MTEHTLPITLKLTGKAGLDPHVAAQFAMVASTFDGDITLAAHGRTVNATSVTDVMSLGAVHNDMIELHAEGAQAQQAVNALIALIQQG
jgi:phosphotransferase system HPr (HPr) family protein